MHPLSDPDDDSPLRDPGPGAPMTGTQLGEHLAHMVWECFTDFLTSEDSQLLCHELGIPAPDGLPGDPAAHELLIFFLWAHTCAARQAFLLGDDDALRATLDALHGAIVEDLRKSGIPGAGLPVFEQRIAARYFEYEHAGGEPAGDIGRIAAAHMSPSRRSTEAAAALLVLQAREITQPLRDFLEDLEVVSPTS